MSILGKVFSAGAGKLVENVGGILDNLTTTKEEKLEAQKKIKDMIMGYEAEMQKQVTERWKVDMQSDSCLLYTSPSPRDRQKSRMPSSA